MENGSKTPDDFLDDAAELFRERNAVYGANYKRAGECLKALFPDGITLETADDQSRYHILMLIIVKLSRYAVNWERGHEDSVDDLITYAAMLKKMDVNAGLYGGEEELPKFIDPRDEPPAFDQTRIGA